MNDTIPQKRINKYRVYFNDSNLLFPIMSLNIFARLNSEHEFISFPKQHTINLLARLVHIFVKLTEKVNINIEINRK